MTSLRLKSIVLLHAISLGLKTIKKLVDQARKAMFSVLQKARKLYLPVEMQLNLFDTMVAPILLYGSEV